MGKKCAHLTALSLTPSPNTPKSTFSKNSATAIRFTRQYPSSPLTEWLRKRCVKRRWDTRLGGLAFTTEKMRKGRRTSPEMGVAVEVAVDVDVSVGAVGVCGSGGWAFNSRDGDRLNNADSWISGCSPLTPGEDTTTCRVLSVTASRRSMGMTGGSGASLSSPRALRRIGGTLPSPSDNRYHAHRIRTDIKSTHQPKSYAQTQSHGPYPAVSDLRDRVVRVLECVRVGIV